MALDPTTKGIYSADQRSPGHYSIAHAIWRSNNFRYTWRKGQSIANPCYVMLYRYLIHLVPLTVSLLFLWLNIVGYPTELHQSALVAIEIGAKIEELLIIASLIAIVYCRLTKHTGSLDELPMLSSSSGLLGPMGRSIRWKDPSTWILIVLGSLITLTAGPATANLMRPRTIGRHEFNTTLWLQGSEHDYWPTVLTSQHIDGGLACFGPEPPYFSYHGLGAILYRPDYDTSFKEPFQHGDLIQDGPRSRWYSKTDSRGIKDGETWSFAPHVATARRHSKFWSDAQWYLQDSHLKEALKSELPVNDSAVRTVCAHDLRHFSNSTTTLLLPLLPEYGTWAHGQNAVKYKTIQLDQPLWAISGPASTNSTDLTTVWIQPDPSMHAVTAGIVVLGPLTSDASERLGIVCSIDARWNNARRLVWSLPDSDQLLANSYRYHTSIPNYPTLPPTRLSKDFLPVNDGSWRHISAQPTWLESLTPIVSLNDPFSYDTDSPGTSTALGKLILASGVSFKNKRSSNQMISKIENVISTSVAVAISRIGLHDSPPWVACYRGLDIPFQQSATNDQYPEACLNETFTPLNLTISRRGCGYMVSSNADYLSVLVLSLYVTVNLVYLGMTVTNNPQRNQNHYRRLKLGQPPIRPAFARIEWTCDCGEHLAGDFDDSVSKDADALATALSKSSSDIVATGTCSDGNSTSESSLSGPSSFGPDVEQSKEAETVHVLRYHRPRKSTQLSGKCFLELCINTGDFHKTLGEVDLSNCTSDGDMFARIRSTYSCIRASGGRQMFLQPVDVRFVQFSLEDRHSVGILNSPLALPPLEEVKSNRYRYSPCPSPGPPMPPHIFLHYLSSKQPHSRAIWLNRLPMKLNQSITCSSDPLPIGWGIHIIEGSNKRALYCCAFVIVTLSVLASLLWAILKDDVQGGFGIGAWMVSVPGFVLMVLHFR